MTQTTMDVLLAIIRDHMNLEIDAAKLSRDTPLGATGLNLASLELVELAMQLEKRLRVMISDDQVQQIASYTVGELVDDLDARLGTAGQ